MAKTILTMLIIKCLFFIYYVSLISLNINVCISEPSPSNSTGGFSVDMFHIYSPESPYYDPSLSPTQIIVDAIQRSTNRNRSRLLNESHPTSTGSGSTETDIIRSSYSESYFMRYKIGSKQVPSLGLLDTGSNLIWTQCFPCDYCFAQSPPHYEPRLSSTYKPVFCNQPECKLLRKPCVGQALCSYYQDYADKTYTVGRLAKDSFTLASEGGTTNWIPGILFGCSLKSNDHKFRGFESGIIGLGRGRLSLVSQLGQFAKGKFSYCMVPITETRKRTTRLLFGDYSEVMPGADEPVVHIPLFVNKNDPDLYYTKLIGFSVGGTRFIQYPDEANFMVDSGATITKLPQYLFYNLKKYVTKALGHLKTKPDPTGGLDLCFATRLKNPRVPLLTLHFDNDASVTFSAINMFGKMDDSTMCLLVLSAGEGRAKLGYMAQANFLVGYDTKQMSFRRTDCTKNAY